MEQILLNMSHFEKEESEKEHKFFIRQVSLVIAVIAHNDIQRSVMVMLWCL